MRNKTKKQLAEEVASLVEDATNNIRLLQLSNSELRTAKLQLRNIKLEAGKLRYDLHHTSLSGEDKVTVMAIVDSFLDSLPSS